MLTDVKAITIAIPEDLDARAAAEAKRRGISKSALIREGLEALLTDEAPTTTGNPWIDLAGFATGEAEWQPSEIGRVVYGL